jgi:hypoxanthine phosphoribosyltransferase
MSKIIAHKDMIMDAVERLALEINKRFVDKDPVLLCVLNGGFMFFSDLVRRLTIKHQVDFVKVSSYGQVERPGSINWLLKPSLDVKGRYVIIVDDILDTGQTAKFIESNLRMNGAKCIWTCVLLSKMANRKVSVFCPLVGMDIDDHFVYGYGLDLEGRERHLTNIYAK